jgi:hypothetical protein
MKRKTNEEIRKTPECIHVTEVKDRLQSALLIRAETAQEQITGIEPLKRLNRTELLFEIL